MAQAKQTPLLPCPFCASIELDCAPGLEGANDTYVECVNCSTLGPSGNSVEVAIELWNRRVQPAEAYGLAHYGIAI